jgi:hypothetical protein
MINGRVKAEITQTVWAGLSSALLIFFRRSTGDTGLSMNSVSSSVISSCEKMSSA